MTEEWPETSWKYAWLHIPTKAAGEAAWIDTKLPPVGRLGFLTAISNWNRAGAGIWQYWALS